MRDSSVARCGRAIAAHADHLFIAALIAAKLAGVELRVVRREESPAAAPAAAAAAPAPLPARPPGAPPTHVHLIGTEARRAAEETSCAAPPRIFPRPESRREQQRRARGMIYGATPDGRPRQAG